MYKIHSTPSIKSKKIIILAVVALLIVAAVLFVRQRQQYHTTAVATLTGASSTINYDPPTKQEQQAANNQKATNDAKQDAIDQAQTTKQPVSIIVSDATYYQFDGNQVEVRAYISNLYESDGVCTATLTHNDKTVTKTSNAFKDAKTTQCGALDIPRSEFSDPGDWQLVVSYASALSSGQSKSQIVSIK